MSTSTTTRALLGALKITAAGATVAAIGWAFLTLAPDGEVPDSSADIWDGAYVPTSHTQRFVGALQRLGHEPPRSYDYNGNTVYFSMRTTQEPPREIVAEYQRVFVEEGVNKKAHLHPPAFDHAALARLDRARTMTDRDEFIASCQSEEPVPERAQKLLEERGDFSELVLSSQIVPIAVGDDYASMGGGLLAGQPESPEEFRELYAGKGRKLDQFEEIFRGYRFIEAFRDRETGQTTVTAAWSDGDFDASRIRSADELDDEPLAARGVPADGHHDLPMCSDCQRTTRFEGENREKPYISSVVHSDKPPREILDFYSVELVERGWSETGASIAARRARLHTEWKYDARQIRQLVRGSERLTLVAEPVAEGTGTP